LFFFIFGKDATTRGFFSWMQISHFEMMKLQMYAVYFENVFTLSYFYARSYSIKISIQWGNKILNFLKYKNIEYFGPKEVFKHQTFFCILFKNGNFSR
jgi:hypothetical protein